jgi:hypothetical protein
MEATEVLMAWGVYLAGAYGLWYAVDWAWWKYVDWYLNKGEKEKRGRGNVPTRSVPRAFSMLA